MSIRRGELAFAAVLALAFGAGPTVGDIGSCGRGATELARVSFEQARKNVDCRRCSGCGLTTQTCRSECDADASTRIAWPSTCRPLQHDGEACLRALEAAGCTDYASFVDDFAPTLPTECDFCHVLPDAGSLDP
ncbi:MAG: hypothetical protein M3O50_11440 [Myxococcota bacterium]|nr:hypothetical protein [Myxococcota bacterium]